MKKGPVIFALLSLTSAVALAQIPPQFGPQQQRPSKPTVLKGNDGGVIVSCGPPVAGRPTPAGECCPAYRQVYPSLEQKDKDNVLASYNQYCTVSAELQLVLACFDPTGCCQQAQNAVTYYQRYEPEANSRVSKMVQDFAKQCVPYAPENPPPTEITVPQPTPPGQPPAR